MKLFACDCCGNQYNANPSRFFSIFNKGGIRATSGQRRLEPCLAGAPAILLIIRPVSGITGLAGAGLPARKMLFISFYGIRGIGSLYYLLYAFHHAPFGGTGEILALVMTVVVLSLALHGLSARAVIKKILPD